MARSSVSSRRTLCALLLVALLAMAAAARPAAAQAPPSQTPEAKPGSVLIRLRDGATAGDLVAAAANAGVELDRVIGTGRVARLKVPAGTSVASVLAALRRHPAVAAAGPDLLAKAFDIPNDPGFARQWDLQAGTGGIDAPAAWTAIPARGAGVTVAVIDTGVAYEDYSGGQGLFGPKVFKRSPDLAGVPIVAPWDWIEGDSHANDENGHGTHVTGTIAEATNNGIAEAGISAASIMPLRILDFSGSGSASDLIDAIYYAADNGARVINMSLGFSGTGSPDPRGNVCTEVVGLADALDYADAMGVAVVAASGNDGAGTVACPAAYPTVIAVGATRYDGTVTFYSNRGGALALTAPGGDPNVDQNADGVADQITQQTYCLDAFTLFFTGQFTQFCDMLYSGTSMASPHVAGVAALLIGQVSTLSPGQVREVLQSTARDAGAPGWDAEYGAGLLDARAAAASVVTNPPPPPPPGPPPKPRPIPQPGATNVAAAALSATTVRVSWTDSAVAETGFRIDRSIDNGVTWTQAGSAGADATVFTNYGLAAGTQYWYRVRSTDSVGSSPWSNVATATTFPPPSAPTNLSATVLGAPTVTLAWTDTSSTEQGFKAERSTDGGATWAVASYAPTNGTAATVTPLTPATTYLFRVRAYDGGVDGPPSNVVSATTFPAPSAPTNVTATAIGASSIRIDWTDTSSTEKGFKVERSTDGASWIVGTYAWTNSSTATVSSLLPGTTYYFRVRAYDGSVDGPASAAVTASTFTAPAAPSNLAAVALGATSVRLNWLDVSATEQGFKVERSADGGVTWAVAAYAPTNATTATVYSLAPLTTYAFRVRGYDGSVDGPPSNVATVTTFGAPPAPANLVATALGTSSIRLTWTDTATTEQGFKVERSTDGGVTFVQFTTLAANTTTWTDYFLLPATTYAYRVRAYEGSLTGLPSNVAAATTVGAPSAPSNLVATAVSATSIRLDWTDTSTGEQGFKLEQSANGGGTWTQIAYISANSTTWTAASLQPATSYAFRIRAYDGAANGDYSNTAVATTLSAPSAPANVVAQPLTTTSIKLTWVNTSPSQGWVTIERSLDGVSWTWVATMYATATTWTNYYLSPLTAYSYRLQALDGPTKGPYSAVVTTTTFGPPPAPTNLVATIGGSTWVRLAWTDNCTYEAGYRVERSLDGVTWTDLGQLPANSTSMMVFFLSPQTAYQFRVRAYEGFTMGAYSSVVTITMP